MMFWVVAALLVALCLVIVLAPVLRGAGTAERRASYDMQIYRDQLREVERDVLRGVVTAEEAEATRTEIARKLLAAADAETRETATRRAPRRASLIGGGLAGCVAFALTGWLYLSQGAPGYPDQPLGERVAQARAAAQAEAEETARIVERLEAAVAENPDDVQGHRFLARELFRLGRLEDAAAAQARVVDLLGEGAAAEEHLLLAQLEFGAAGGEVSPAAEAALRTALDRDPDNPVARYLWGVKRLQDGDPAETLAIWTELREEGPPDAPWVLAIAEEIDAVATQAGAPERAGPPPATASARPPEVEAMVEGLAARLAREGGPPGDWAQLIRSLGVLGRIDQAAAIYDEAQTAFASDPSALATVTEAARDARLLQ